jgi:hypothetical protein
MYNVDLVDAIIGGVFFGILLLGIIINRIKIARKRKKLKEKVKAVQRKINVRDEAWKTYGPPGYDPWSVNPQDSRELKKADTYEPR